MSSKLLSVIIPARNEQFLSKTVDDLIKKATGNIEVVVILDGYWPNPPLKDYPELVIVHRGSSIGMRSNTNLAARIAKGKYLMKCDGHCIFGEGFDEILQADCEENWLAVPSRYSLDAEKWERTRGPVDYLTLTFPYIVDELYGNGLHGKKWKGKHGLTGSFWCREKERKHILIDDLLSFQGSCWFMHKKRFFEIGCMDEINYSSHQEAQEMGMKVWLSGGRVIRNKKTWYAHLHKGPKYGKGHTLSKKAQKETQRYCTNLWMNDKWEGQTRSIKWLIDKFWPLEGWPDDWQDPKYAEGYEPTGWIGRKRRDNSENTVCNG